MIWDETRMGRMGLIDEVLSENVFRNGRGKKLRPTRMTTVPTRMTTMPTQMTTVPTQMTTVPTRMPTVRRRSGERVDRSE